MDEQEKKEFRELFEEVAKTFLRGEFIRQKNLHNETGTQHWEQLEEKIIQTHGLRKWEWGDSSTIERELMIHGAATAIRCLYEEGRELTVYVHKSGTLQIDLGPLLGIQIGPRDKEEICEYAHWEDDPVVAQYHIDNAFTLCWDGYEGEGALFPDDEREKLA